MFIELVDALRCPNPHEDSWLVLAAGRAVARHVLDGTLGCHVCHAEFTIADGAVHFGAPDGATPSTEADADQAMRLAAFLGLSEPHGFALLAGQWGAHAEALRSLTPTQLVLLNPPQGVRAGPGISVIHAAGGILPLSVGSVRAAALDDATLGILDAAVRAVRAKGRIVAPASAAPPADVEELARDASVWVGEVRGASTPLVRLEGRRRG